MEDLNMQRIHELLSRHPGLPQAIGMDKAIRFIRLTASLKRSIIHAQKPGYNQEDAPELLPDCVHEFLGSALDLSDEFVQGCWDTFKRTIWLYDPALHSSAADAKVFHKHAKGHNLASRSLYPPCVTCTNPLCAKDTELLRKTTKAGRKVVLYTLEDGACAAYHYKLVCPACKTTFHNNYSVYNRIRTYYPGVPDAIEVGKHQFVARDVLNMFLNLMLISWTSATNCAEVYNRSLSKSENQPKEWSFSFDLRSEHIWNGISHLAILEHYEREGEILTVPHGFDQKDRLSEPIRKRNKLFEDEGQPEWAHYCEKCVRFTLNDKGEATEMVRAIVSDGITIGHPCCGVAHCTEPLANVKRDRFCPGHQYVLKICAVERCEREVETGYLTCDDPIHRKLEETRKQADLPADLSTDAGPVSDACPQKPDSGIHRVSARFGRRQTHNEQLLVRPCGMIIARTTFYGSETVPQTVAFLKKVFKTPGSMPEFFIYDNCCGVYNHLLAQKDPLLKTVGFPVDAFHYDCKHSRTDIVCREHCNPRLFPELLFKDGTWYFNSSKCEQINVWLGGYHAILREMKAERYEFLLDELIMRKNRALKAKLEKEDVLPSYIPGLRYNS
ncbi:hypothetical protein BDZ97DRAFT_1980385 [Flammula alnicola]|nr:hypothetical protein BDZ97DRAFT_1980385 [Flammula alnicola]